MLSGRIFRDEVQDLEDLARIRGCLGAVDLEVVLISAPLRLGVDQHMDLPPDLEALGMASVAEDFPGRPCEVEIQESPHEVVNDERILVRPALQGFDCFSGDWHIPTRLRPLQHIEHDGAPCRQVVAHN